MMMLSILKMLLPHRLLFWLMYRWNLIRVNRVFNEAYKIWCDETGRPHSEDYWAEFWLDLKADLSRHHNAMMKVALPLTVTCLLAGSALAQIVDITIHPPGQDIPKERQSRGFRRAATGGGTNMLVNPAGLDPGIRTGSPTAGGLSSGLSTDEVNFANAGLNSFTGAWSVTGSILGEPFPGLGPYYDANACGVCHSYPAPGGSSPLPNDEYTQATIDGATNNIVLAPFITSSGPTRIPYQISTGQIGRLWSIAGRSDAAGCTAPQIDFRPLIDTNDLSYHIPVPLFGLGLVESTPDDELISRQITQPGGVTWTMSSLGIMTGRFNHSATGIATIGWKGGASSVRWFADLALAVELGVTSEIFHGGRWRPSSCRGLPTATATVRTGAHSPGGSITTCRTAICNSFPNWPPSTLAGMSGRAGGSIALSPRRAA
jgi:hypothetical protein